MIARAASRGQVLVLFVLFLLVLLGVAALGIDYASWLLMDRKLQNVSDHASLAGASEFDQRIGQGNCSGGLGAPKCVDARAQAWTSLNEELNLGLTGAAIGALAAADSPAGGQADGNYGGQAVTFADRIWVTTPPPSYAAYTDAGGRYAQNFGVVFVRVDREVRSFLGGALGIQPSARTGWSTAGALPTDFALEVFCRNNIAPQNGVCESSAGLALSGNGVMVKLIRGDIGSNESLTVTSQNGTGVIVESGNMFLVNRSCANNTWSCPETPAVLGGISDRDLTVDPTGNNKNAFYIAPLPVPQFASPLGNASTPLADTTIKIESCVGADADNLCVPYRPVGAGGSPGVWTCDSAAAIDPCGDPLFDTVNGTVTCVARPSVTGTPDNHLDPITGGANLVNAQATPNQNNANKYRNIDDDWTTPAPDTTTPPAVSPTDSLWVNNLNHPNNPPISTITTDFTVNLNQPYGTPNAGATTIRYVAYKTNSGTPDNAGYPVTLTVSLLQSGTVISTDPTIRTLTGTPTRYEDWTVGNGVITDYNSLSLRFSFQSANQANNNTNERGGGISWAEAETPTLQPVTYLPPMIPPGYYHTIEIDDDGCAVLDPTGVYSGLAAYQMPGIYRFEGDNQAAIKIGEGSALIGDGVTLVFDYGFPDPTGGRGIVIGNDGVLSLNTSRVPGTPACTPSEVETVAYNPSTPLADLPSSSVCAAWGIDPTVTAVFRPGASSWPYCDPADAGLPQCVGRSSYNPVAGFRGVTFYFTPNAWPATDITGRFQQGGGAGETPGMSFRGVMYAPYDDVKMSGGCNGFNDVGQVLAWTAKFNGGCGYIELDYPYDYTPASPYLLEPTVDR